MCDCIVLFLSYVVGMAGVTPALLDPTIDSGHRSFLAKVQHQELNVLRPRPPAELVAVDPRWGAQVICRLFSVFIRYTFRYIMY